MCDSMGSWVSGLGELIKNSNDDLKMCKLFAYVISIHYHMYTYTHVCLYDNVTPYTSMLHYMRPCHLHSPLPVLDAS